MHSILPYRRLLALATIGHDLDHDSSADRASAVPNGKTLAWHERHGKIEHHFHQSGISRSQV